MSGGRDLSRDDRAAARRADARLRRCGWSAGPAVDPDRYRALFRRVGAPLAVVLAAGDGRCRAASRKVGEVHAVRRPGRRARSGCSSSISATAGECLIRFLGLVPELAGQGHGRWLFAQTLALAWRPGVRAGRGPHLHARPSRRPARLSARRLHRLRRAFESFPDPRLPACCRATAPQIRCPRRRPRALRRQLRRCRGHRRRCSAHA